MTILSSLDQDVVSHTQGSSWKNPTGRHMKNQNAISDFRNPNPYGISGAKVKAVEVRFFKKHHLSHAPAPSLINRPSLHPPPPNANPCSKKRKNEKKKIYPAATSLITCFPRTVKIREEEKMQRIRQDSLTSWTEFFFFCFFYFLASLSFLSPFFYPFAHNPV